jgi:hypothetical protein
MPKQAMALSRSTLYRRFMERLPVRTPDRRLVRLRFNAAQEQLWQVVAPRLDAGLPIQMIILKARREGVSTFTEALLTAICIFQDYTQALVVAHLKSPAERIWQMSERFVRSSPLEGVADIKRRAIRFRHSALELATAGTPEASRSADLTCLHASELAFWKQAGALLAIRQCLPQEDDAFFVEVDESTANGMVDTGGLFYDEWNAAVAGESSMIPVFLPWHTFPQYTSRLQEPLDDMDGEEEALMNDLALTPGQLRWRRRVIADRCQNSVDKFNQEYPSTPEMAFLMSGLPFFRERDLVWVEPLIEPGRRGRLIEHRGRVRFLDDARGPLRVFRPPLPGREYVVGADSSMGIQDQGAQEHSRSAAEVLDMGTLEQVAEYDHAAPPHLFARDLALLGRAYNTALIAPEVQASGGGGGRELIVYLRDQYNYPNLHRWSTPDRIRQGQPVLYGWETNARTRPRMIARIQEVVLEKGVTLHSRALVRQLRAFGESDSGKLEALAGHDDLLFAFGIALMSRSENYVVKRGVPLHASPPFPFAQAGVEHTLDPLDRDATVLSDLLSAYGETGAHAPTEMLAW